jgi:hypothetical protein
MSYTQNTQIPLQQQYITQQLPVQQPIYEQPTVLTRDEQPIVLTRDEGSQGGQGGQGGQGVSQDECINQYPLPPSSVPTGDAPDVDENHVGVNLEFTPVIDVVFNKPKLRLANFANGKFSTKCYRQSN